MKINLKFYYLFLLALNVAWLFLGRAYYNNYSPFIWFVNGPLFAVLYCKNMAAFSTQLRIKEPLLYKRHEIPFGYFKGEMVSNGSLFGNSDFKKLTDAELVSSYRRAQQSYNYLLLCFISFGVSGVITVFVK